MNSLLLRQLRKKLEEKYRSDKNLQAFFEAVNNSYNNFDDQFLMLQRAMSISSDELVEANLQLKKETESQQLVINKLRSILSNLNFAGLQYSEGQESVDIDESKLLDFIENQTNEIVKINKQRDILLNNLEYQNKELSDYAHMVSHDLKSPLRSIDALTSWIHSDYKDKLDDAGVKNLDLIRTNVDKMELLINGILDYSSIGRNKDEIQEVNLNLLINNYLNQTVIPDHIEIIIKDDLPVVKGDKFRLLQLFQNIIGNAIKYNDKEKGIIEILYFDSKDYWSFRIKDNGKGIDKKYFEKIFKTFYKLENNKDSTGIGLSIVKKIIDLYQGNLWVDSKVNEGTIFYFSIKKVRN
ncbi:phospho-acceptor domain-containing protein [Lutibacter sp. Hel_I_33_5]|uniref:sensor histidine kinase n=1 Tax=Lutibacter sp. Hel_I_33_5 TaxID=1566289 RepID=UPI0011A2BD77|nr:ATP-binding protein [Lutibacter sp. Hel_I_33_5]TVZ55862.1 phospho-acceptor domain-containing protein [Lutibacter sp. Hel_I_33_5]